MTTPSDANVVLQIGEGIGRITLNRPDRHNAFDDVVIKELAKILVQVAVDPEVRVVVLGANGKSFSAGADLAWMKRTATYTVAENETDALVLAEMLSKLNTLPKPTVALVQGGAYGEHMMGTVAVEGGTQVDIPGDGSAFTVRLAPGAGGRLTISQKRFSRQPTFTFPWDR